MNQTHSSSDLWDWPTSRTGQAAMALLALAIVLPFLVPLFVWITPITVEGEAVIGWVVVPVMIAAGLAMLSCVLALAAIILRRERSLYLAFPFLAALIVVLVIVPGA
jgi:hypothetical protein